MSKLLPKYAHSPGRTNLSYSPDGKYLFSVGVDRLIRKFTVGSTDEPDTVEHHDGDIMAVATSENHFATCSEDGTVSLFDIKSNDYKGLLTRSSLPIRDIAFTPDGQFLAAVGDDDSSAIIRIINVDNILETSEITLDDVDSVGGVRSVAFSPKGDFITVSCGDNSARIFSWRDRQQVQRISGVTPSIKSLGDEACTSVAFHPDEKHFAVPTKAFEIGIYEITDPSRPLIKLSGVHNGPMTDLQWSPNGGYLCSSGPSGQLAIWKVSTRELIANHTINNSILFLHWHPSANVLSFTTDQGQLYTLTAAIPGDLSYGAIHPLNVKSSSGAEEQDDFADANEDDMGGDLDDQLERSGSRTRSTSVDIMGDPDQEDWIVDDDGAGYKTQKKRPADYEYSKPKRPHVSRPTTYAPELQPSFQSGSTPWRNSRRYLCMNFLGYAWAVEQEGDHNTVTVSFFDRELHREFHFTDYNKYDLASLSEMALLLASTDHNKVFLRFHDGYTDNWEYEIESGDTTRAISLSESLVVITTTRGYVHTFNLYGTPLHVYRQSRHPVITCASWKDFFMIVRTNPADGSLTYSIEDGKGNQCYQKDDYLEIGEDSTLAAAFFSEDGDPCIYDSNGVLLVLLHWRNPLQAKWVPIVSSADLKEGRQESYWPLGLSNENKFHCIIMKGEATYPNIPLPISSEFDLTVPVKTAEDMERQYLTQNVLYELAKDRISDSGDSEGEILLSKKELELDKLVLRLLQLSCRQGKHAKSVGLVALLRKEQAFEAAAKIALRLEMGGLAEKIEKMREDLLAR